MLDLRIESFKNDEELIYYSLLLAYLQKSNNVLFLKHGTMYQYLEPASKDTLRKLFLQFQVDYSVEDSVVGFLLYLKKHRNTYKFQCLLRDVSEKRKSVIYRANLMAQIPDELIYFCRCYYRPNSALYFSIFRDTSLKYLAVPNLNVEDIVRHPRFVKLLDNLSRVRLATMDNLLLFIKSTYPEVIAEELYLAFVMVICDYICTNNVIDLKNLDKLKNKICMQYCRCNTMYFTEVN